MIETTIRKYLVESCGVILEEHKDFKLEKQFYELIGLSLDDTVMFEELERWEELISPLTSSGWSYQINTDDFTIIIHKDGKPHGGFHFSSRGSLFQAGCWVAETNKCYGATNLTSREELTPDTWTQVELCDWITASIAREFLIEDLLP